MTRLKPPTRKVPNGATTGSSTTMNTRSMVQIVLIMTIVACVMLTVFVNIKSTSTAVLEGLHYGAAVTTAMICVAVGLACAENFLYVFLLGGTSEGAIG